MNVLVIGSGGREHALVWKIAQSPLVSQVYCAPGNPGVASVAKGANAPIDVTDFAAVADFISENDITLTVVGPEVPLCAGIVDYLAERKHRVFGPSEACARIEGSKGFAKDFMRRFHIPTADYACFIKFESAEAYVREVGAPLVIKADGLAAGKGVTVARDMDTAVEALRASMLSKQFGDAGGSVVIESCLEGEEASILAFCDGRTFRTLATSQDHKAAFDGDTGPNTGGMGAYSPAPVVTPELMARIEAEVLQPFMDGMRAIGTPYKGIIYAGLMMTANGPQVIEFNCRLGDPETQCVLPRMTCDIVPVFEACIDGKLDDATVSFDSGACVTVVLASGGYPGDFPKGLAITGIANAETDPDVAVFHAGTMLKDGALLTNGGRVLNVTARAESLPTAIDRAYTAVPKVSFEGLQYRTDIGRKALARLG